MPDALPPIVVLCGGLGTRLRAVVADRPKVLADVAGRPFLAHLLDHLAAQGAREVVFSAGHLAGQIADFAADFAAKAPQGLRLRTVVEEAPLGTGGALRFAASEAGLDGTFVALNGDTFFAGALARLVDAHRAARAPLTLALARVADAARYGTVRFEPSTGLVTAFEEKGASGAGWINAGAYVVEAAALAALAPGQPASLECDTLPALVGHGLLAVPFPDAAFLDIGLPADYARAAALLSHASS